MNYIISCNPKVSLKESTGILKLVRPGDASAGKTRGILKLRVKSNNGEYLAMLQSEAVTLFGVFRVWRGLIMMFFGLNQV